MENNWKSAKLIDFCSVITKGTTPRGGYLAKNDSDIVTFVRAENVDKGIIGRDGFKYISTTTHTKELKRSILQKDDILITIAGTLGRLAIVPEDIIPANTNQAVGIIRMNNKNVDVKYIYYYLSNPLLMNPLVAASSGQSVQPNLNLQQVGNIEIKYPSLPVQKKISSILSSIDDKIELNNKMNANLEEQAEAIYNEFFSSKSTDKKLRALDEFCNIFTGRKNANENDIDGLYKFFTCAPDSLLINSFIYDGNAIIVSGNGAYTGRTRFYSGKFDLYQRTYACTIKNDVESDYIFPLYWFIRFNLSKKIMGGTRGSAIPYIVMNDLAKYEFVFDDDQFRKYIPIFKIITIKQLDIEKENLKLVELRDTLLPKLMSGEIDVEDLDI